MTALDTCSSSPLHRAPHSAHSWRPSATGLLTAAIALGAWIGGATPALAAGPTIHPSAPLTSTLYAWHPATVDSQAFLPVLGDYGAGTSCNNIIRVQNMGHDAAKAVLVVWGEEGLCPPQCSGPSKVDCSGLIKPGGTWSFLDAQVGAGARSGWVGSFNVRQMAEIVPGWQDFDDVVADYMCETLFFGVVGDCDDFRRFQNAFNLGLSFAGVPQDLAAGGPIAVWATRDCPVGARPPESRAVYTGLRAADVGGFYEAGRTYRYVIPAGAPTLADPALRALHVQNAGLECITVKVLANVDCGQAAACPEITLAPGERHTFGNMACDLEQGGTLEASGPVAAVLDDWGTGNIATLPLASEQRFSYATGTIVERQAGGAELSAPLVYRDYQGWSTGFVLQNLSRETEAQVRILVLDRSGDIVSSYQAPRICPLGTLYIAPGTIADMPGNFVGAVRVVSVDWWLPGSGVTDQPRLAGWALATTATGGGDALAYPLLARHRSEDWPPPAEQVGLIAVPLLTKAADDGDLTTELAIANTVQRPGFTDFAIYIYDQNGMLDYICQKLNEKQVEYINLQSWGYVNSGFVGSAVVSAMFWEHDVFDNGQWLRNDLGLEAVAAARPARKEASFPPQLQPIAGNEPSWAAVGGPFTLLAGQRFGFGFDFVGSPQCPAIGTRPTPPRPGWTPTPAGTPAATATPTRATTPTPTTLRPAPAFLPVVWSNRTGPTPPPPTPTPATGAEAEGEGAPYLPPSPQVFVPVLSVRGADTPCRAQVHVMNVGAQPSVALLVLWDNTAGCDDACGGPQTVVCSGLIRPGARWTFAPESGRNAAIFSIRGGTLADIGVPDQASRTIAAVLCDGLSGAFASCDGGTAYAAFKDAYDSGGTYLDVPLDKAMGSPLAVQVERRCPGDVVPNNGTSSSYGAVPATDTGAFDAEVGGYGFYVPLLYAAKASFTSSLYIQNAGDECGSVDIWLKAQDDCLRARSCRLAVLAPGAAIQFSPESCVGEGWQGSAWLHSTQPLAVAVDLIGRDTLMTYVGEAESTHHPETGSPEETGSSVLFAPLYYSEYQGWDTGVQVQNMSRDTNAKVKAYFLDRSGDIVTTLVDWICPASSQTFFLPVTHDLPGTWAGSIRVESQQWWTPSADASAHIPRITGVVTLIRHDTARRERTIAAAAYNLVPEADAFDWKTGRGEGGLTSGVGLIALPHLTTPDEQGARTEIAITNAVPQRGFTAFTLALFDANGRVGDVCLELTEKQVAYLDLGRWGYLTPNFSASALISATYWNHDVLYEGDNFQRRVVGLMAAVVERHGTALGEDVAGDELSISTGIPLRGAVAEALLPVLAGVGCQIVVRDDEPAVPQPDLGAAAGELLVPALRSGPGQSPCDAEITVQNLGRPAAGNASSGSGGTGGAAGAESKVLLVAWGAAACPADCTPAVGVLCTGLLKPGGSWTLSTATLPAGAVAGTLFSLAPTAVDQLCPLLAGATGPDCSRIRSFVDAYRGANGGNFEGISLASGHGPAIAAEVLRDCPATADSTLATTASYQATSRGAAADGDTQQGWYRYDLPQLGTVSGAGESVIIVQNAGDRCATVELTVTRAGGGGFVSNCASATVPPAGSARLALANCVPGGRRLLGAGRIRSDQPLAVVVDTAAPYSLSSYSGRAADSSTSTVLFGPLTYSEYQSWDIAVHVQNANLDRAGLVKIVFLDRSGDKIDTLVDWLPTGGAIVVNLDKVADLPGNWVGSVRVESLDYDDDTGTRVPAVAVGGVVRMVRGRDVADASVPAEAAAYRLMTSGFAGGSSWPFGTASGQLTADQGLLALPHLFKLPDDTPGGSEIAIANLVTVPGFTDFVLYLLDQNGVVDSVCHRFNEQQVEYINLATWGYVPENFHGSAVISATFWDHEVRDPTGTPIRNLVGLGAVLIQRSGARLGKDLPGDELAIDEAWPLPAGAWRDLGLMPFQCPGSGQPPASTPTPAAASRQVP